MNKENKQNGRIADKIEWFRGNFAAIDEEMEKELRYKRLLMIEAVDKKLEEIRSKKQKRVNQSKLRYFESAENLVFSWNAPYCAEDIPPAEKKRQNNYIKRWLKARKEKFTQEIGEDMTKFFKI